jgi:hypothetical protein
MDSVCKTAFFLSSFVVTAQLMIMAILFFCGVREIERLVIAAIFIGVAARLMTKMRKNDFDEGFERACIIILTFLLVYGVVYDHTVSLREHFIAAVIAAGIIILADILNPKMKGKSEGFFIPAPLIMAIPQVSIIVAAAILVIR